MPIGKNSLKRVTNNGYSSVKTSAPDMENSEIVSEVKPTTQKTTAPAKSAPKKPASTAKKTESAKTAKPAEKKPENKPAAKKSPAKSTAKPEPKVSATTIPAPAEVVMAVVDPGKKDNGEKSYCNIGDKMPHFLL